MDPATPQHQEFVGHILSSGRHLLQLVKDVLDLSKIEAGKMEFRPEATDLTQVIEEVVAMLRTMASAKAITVETSIDPDIASTILDPARFKQVLYNDLSNALKFTPEGGRVAVRVRPEGAETFRLEVEAAGWEVWPAPRPQAPVIAVTIVSETKAITGFPVHDLFTKPIDSPAILASLERAGVTADRAGSVLVVDDDPSSPSPDGGDTGEASIPAPPLSDGSV